MSAERTFVDTNVLVYLFDNDAPEKQARARDILASQGSAGQLVISTQVLQEFYVTVTRKLTIPLPPNTAYQAVQDLLTLSIRQVTSQLVLSAIQRSIAIPLSFWDALIVETALDAQAMVLLTEDLQHNRFIDGLRIENPFL